MKQSARDERRHDKFLRTIARFYAYGRLDQMSVPNLVAVHIVDDFVEHFIASDLPSVFSVWITYAARLTELQEAGYSTYEV